MTATASTTTRESRPRRSHDMSNGGPGGSARALVVQLGTVGVLIVCAIAVALSVTTHLIAAPGEEVSVIWGMFSYVKRPSVPQTENGESDDDTLPPLERMTIEIEDNVTRDKHGASLAELRQQYSLKELNPLHSLSPIVDSPAGTFFFTSYVYIKISQSYQLEDMLSKSSISREQQNRFEVHHRDQGEYFIVCYVCDCVADEIEFLSGDSSHRIKLFPLPWESYDTRIELPIERIVRAEGRLIEIGEENPVGVVNATIR